MINNQFKKIIINLSLAFFICSCSNAYGTGNIEYSKRCKNNIPNLLIKDSNSEALILNDKKTFYHLNKSDLLFCSLYHDQKKKFKSLLKNSSNKNFKLSNGKSVLHYAAMLKDDYYLKLLLQNGINVDLIDSKNKWKPTPLYYAVVEGNLQGVKLLLEFNSDLDYLNSMGQTPLLMAAILKDYKMVYYLLSQGANFNHQDNVGDNLKKLLEENIISHDSNLFKDKYKVILFLKNKGIDITY